MFFTACATKDNEAGARGPEDRLRDFEKCAPFEEVVWVTGEVKKRKKYNTGPGDRFMKWMLVAKMCHWSRLTM